MRKRIIPILLLASSMIAVPVSADVSSDLSMLEEQLGIDNSDKKTINRLVELEEQLGISPNDEANIVDRIAIVKTDLGIVDKEDSDFGEEALREEENTNGNSMLVDSYFGGLTINTGKSRLEQGTYNAEYHKKFSFLPNENYLLMYRTSDSNSLDYVKDGQIDLFTYEKENPSIHTDVTIWNDFCGQ